MIKYGNFKELKRCKKLGFYGFIKKCMSELLGTVNRMIGQVTNITGLYRYIIWVDYLQLLEALNGFNEDRLQGQRTSPRSFSIVVGMCVLKIL